MVIARMCRRCLAIRLQALLRSCLVGWFTIGRFFVGRFFHRLLSGCWFCVRFIECLIKQRRWLVDFFLFRGFGCRCSTIQIDAHRRQQLANFSIASSVERGDGVLGFDVSLLQFGQLRFAGFDFGCQCLDLLLQGSELRLLCDAFFVETF